MKNLKTTRYNDSTLIPHIETATAWNQSVTPGYCWYNNDVTHKPLYGAIYNWYVIETKKLAPVGWHVPSTNELNSLMSLIGGPLVAGGKLKDAGTRYWQAPNEGGTDSVGFTALPGGYRKSDGSFTSINKFGYWWLSIDVSMGSAMCYFVNNYQAELLRNATSKVFGYSVRCVRDW